MDFLRLFRDRPPLRMHITKKPKIREESEGKTTRRGDDENDLGWRRQREGDRASRDLASIPPSDAPCHDASVWWSRNFDRGGGGGLWVAVARSRVYFCFQIPFFLAQGANAPARSPISSVAASTPSSPSASTTFFFFFFFRLGSKATCTRAYTRETTRMMTMRQAMESTRPPSFPQPPPPNPVRARDFFLFKTCSGHSRRRHPQRIQCVRRDGGKKKNIKG